MAPRGHRHCAAPTKELKKQRENDAQQNRGRQREVEREVPSLDIDVSGQSPDVRDLSDEQHESPHGGKTKPEQDQQLAERVHLFIAPQRVAAPRAPRSPSPQLPLSPG